MPPDRGTRATTQRASYTYIHALHEQVIRSPLETAVEKYNPKTEIVVLFRARCGYMAVVVLPLVPEWAVCRQLGVEYKEKDALQLNLDDTD